MMNDECLDAMAMAVAMEYPVFPCSPTDKRPRTAHGFKDATQDLDQIAAWWATYPDSLIGIPTGAASGIVVIDDDTAKKPDAASSAWLARTRVLLDGTRRQTTKSGGTHYVYKRPEGVEIKTRAAITVEGQKLASIDTRGEGGYIIFWPAHGLASVGEVQPMPQALIDMLCDASVSAGTTAAPADWVWNARARELPEALAFLNPVDRDEWTQIGMAIHHDSGATEGAFNLWHRWSRGDFTGGDVPDGYVGEADCRKIWASFGKDKTRKPKTLKSLYALARKNGYKPVGNVAAPAPEPSEVDPRPVIQLNGGKFDQYSEQAEHLLGDTIYVRGESLVRIGRAADISQAIKVDGKELFQDAAGTQREGAQAVCIQASAGWIRRELMRRAQFWKFDKRSGEWDARDCPKELAESIGDQRSWATFRPLVTISPAPILRPDMSVCEIPGYDGATGIYYQPTVRFPPIIHVPTRDDALWALNRLYEPFGEFPFASPEAAAVFLAHCITTVLRPSFDTSPIFVYTASQAASGKTLLASMPTRIAHGNDGASNPYSEGEELRKVLFSSLLAGDAALLLDNVPSGIKVDAAVLCAFTTSPMWGDRILGVSERRKLPNRTTVGMTGNNITPVGDLSRRSLVVRLDVNAESARGRTFRIKDLRGYVNERRASLIVDVITIVRAYAFAGSPEVAHPLESFEQWSRLARDPLVWLGMPDPVASQATETEDDVGALREVFAILAAVTAAIGHVFTSSQLAPLTVASGLREAMLGAGCVEPTDAGKLGYWLRAHRGRVAGGWKLDRNGSVAWRLAKL